MDPHPEKPHRRSDPAVHARSEAHAKGDPGDSILQALADSPGRLLAEVLQTAGVDSKQVRSGLARLIDRGELLVLSGDPSIPESALVCSRSSWSIWRKRISEALERYHAEFPLKSAMPREELRSRLKIHPKALGPLLARAAVEGVLMETARGVKLPIHVPQMYPEQSRAAELLRASFSRDPFNPPSVKECVAEVGGIVFDALVENGTLTQVSEEVVFLHSTYEDLVDRIRAELATRGKITVAETRDLFRSSRKYILALLEHLDAQGITRREGDYRMLK
jgi:selenocysteine-specific elongation factor